MTALHNRSWFDGHITRCVMYAVTFCSVWLSASAFAKEMPVISLLKENQFAQLEKQMSAYQAAYERETTKADLIWEKSFYWFDNPDPDIDVPLDKWIKEYPKSFSAHIARGLHFFARASEVRGEGYVSEVPDARLKEMREWHQKAKVDLLAAINLTKKPLWAYEYLIFIAWHGGLEQESRDWLDESIRIDPDNARVRRVYLLSLRPQWGGDFQAMQNFVDKTNKDKISDKTRRILESHLWRAKARESRIAGDRKKAIQYYSTALNLYEESDTYVNRGREYQSIDEIDKALMDFAKAIKTNPRNVDAYVARGNFYRTRNNTASAFADYERATQLAPRNADALMNRGYMYWMQGKLREAAEDYERASSLGNAWAQNELAKMLWAGRGISINKEKAWVLWEQSAAQGNREAAKSLKDSRDHR